MTYRKQQTSLFQFFRGHEQAGKAAAKPCKAATVSLDPQAEESNKENIAQCPDPKQQFVGTVLHCSLPETESGGICAGAARVEEETKQPGSSTTYAVRVVSGDGAETEHAGKQASSVVEEMLMNAADEAAQETPLATGLDNPKAKHVLEKEMVADSRAFSMPGAKRKRVEIRDVGQELTTDYERRRAENIRRNEGLLASLGIDSQILAPKKAPALGKPKLGKKLTPEPQMPIRRSARSLGITLEHNPLSTAPTLSSVASKTEEVAEPIHYDESTVRKYVCRVQPNEECPEDLTPEKIDSLQPVGHGYCDPLMMRVYALTTYKETGAELLAAGGHVGRLAIYGLRETDAPASDCARADAEEGTADEPLLTWRGGAGWISAVQFLTHQREGATLLLTSSNDKSVVLWDIDKSSGSGEPRAVARNSTLHSSGIFGMHEFEGQIATASKDKTVGITTVSEGGFSPLTVLSGHHSAAVRAVHFRDSHHLADGSADCSVAISDLRLADPASIHIESAHRTAINVVQWHPANEHLLMSASHDRGIHLHDIRSPQQPLFTFTGHLGPGLAGSKSIYRPSFLAAGKYVASPGEQSQALSLYDTATGKTVSRGCLGYDATMTMAGANGRHLWVAAQGGVVQRYRGSSSG